MLLLNDILFLYIFLYLINHSANRAGLKSFYLNFCTLLEYSFFSCTIISLKCSVKQFDVV